MLPFMKPKKMAATIIQNRAPAGNVASESVEGESKPEMLAHAQALISAVHSKDAEAVAKVLEAITAEKPSEE